MFDFLFLQKMWLCYLTVKRRKWWFFIQRHQPKLQSGCSNWVFYAQQLTMSECCCLKKKKKKCKSLFLLLALQDPDLTRMGQQHLRKERKSERGFHEAPCSQRSTFSAPPRQNKGPHSGFNDSQQNMKSTSRLSRFSNGLHLQIRIFYAMKEFW